MELRFTVPFTADAITDAIDQLNTVLDTLTETSVVTPTGTEAPIPAPPTEQVPPPPFSGVPTTRTPSSTEIPPPPPTEVPAADAEVDSGGIPWDATIHAANKAKKQDGTWKQRRGTGKKAPNENVTVKQVQEAVGLLLAGGLSAEEINKPISQAVASDLKVETGGMKSLRAMAEPGSAAFRAMNACRAIAVIHGVEL